MTETKRIGLVLSGWAPAMTLMSGAMLGFMENFGTLCPDPMAVEQNVPATLKLVDRAIILKSGRIVFDGAARELEAQKDLWQWF